MNIFKKRTLAGILSGLFLFPATQGQNLQKTLIQFTAEHSIYSYNYNSGAIILFQPRKKGLTAEFTTKATSAKYLTSLKQKCVAINGYYFGYGGGGFQPAGPVTRYIGLNKTVIIPSDTNPADDVNLGSNIFYNSMTNKISIGAPIKIIKGASFFAGPLLVDHGLVNTNLNQKISHRSSKHYRTFVIQDEKNKAIRGITTEKISLPDLAASLQTIYANKQITVVNLDGGSSTSFASEKFSYNENKALPMFFHSCK